MKNSKSIQFKIAIVYIILFGAALFSGGYIFKQVEKITLPEQSVIEESNKIFLISSTITSLYSSEAASRNAILTGKAVDEKKYQQELDSVTHQIDLIQLDIEDGALLSKLDTVQQLLDKKKNSFKEILAFRKTMNASDNYDLAMNKIYMAKEQIEKDNKPVVEISENQKRSFISRVVKAMRSESDTVKTTIKQTGLTDSLALAVEKIFAEAAQKENKVQKELLKKEHQLLLENKRLTDQLRFILESVEHNILQSSYEKIHESRTIIGNATTNIAWIGGSALITVVLLGWIILKDLNQTQRYRTQLEKLNAEKEVLLRSKTMLLATVTHDIQTPLGSVLGFSDMLGQTALDSKQQGYIKNIKHSSQYIVNLVNDLIDFSKLENNKISIEPKPFNFKELLESTCTPLQPNAQAKNIRLDWKCEPRLDAFLLSDPYRIRQILTNLITNAIKFTQEGGVSIHAGIEGKWIEVSVADSGMGIAADDLDHIFKEFKQAHEGIEKKFGGTGLGLNISKRMVELLGGSIQVRSSLDKGSVFTVLLPLQLADSKDLENTHTPAPFDLSILRDKRILMIDDDALQLQLLTEVLDPLVCYTRAISDASPILKILRQEPFDLILTDMQMPKVDGFELIQLLKSDATFAEIPVMALSGKRDLSAEDFLELGFSSSHPKPVQVNKLLSQIMGLFGAEVQEVQREALASMTVDLRQTYSLEGLKQFVQDDREAMKNILGIFVNSTADSLAELNSASAAEDFEAVGNTAHKMLPMFKQLEIYSVVELLEPLEDHSLDFNDAESLHSYIQEVEGRIVAVLAEIKNTELA